MNTSLTNFQHETFETDATDTTDVAVMVDEADATAKAVVPVIISNIDFLSAVFNNDLGDACPLLASFEGNPANISGKAWMGWPWQGEVDLDHSLPACANNYFSLAVFRPDEAGQYRRQKTRFHALHAVMLDDVGTKVAIERLNLAPSWMLETSPGNYQAGYLLREPLRDGAIADRLMGAVIAASLCDPGANGPRARLARLPVAINGKHTPPFHCHMEVWSPQLRYSIAELVNGLELEMPTEGRVKRQSGRSAQARPSDGDPVWLPRPNENSVMVALQERGLYKAPHRSKESIGHHLPVGAGSTPNAADGGTSARLAHREAETAKAHRG